MTVHDWRLRLGRVLRAGEAASFFQCRHLDPATADRLQTATRGAVSLSTAEQASAVSGFGCSHPACLVEQLFHFQQVELREAFDKLYYDASKAEDSQLGSPSNNNDWLRSRLAKGNLQPCRRADNA